MQVAAYSEIDTKARLRGEPSDSLAFAPLGRRFGEVETTNPEIMDIVKVIIAEKLTKANLKAFGFLTFD